MQWLLSILGVLLGIFGVIWILQGLDILKSGMMAGHIQYALLGLVALIVGAVLLAFANRRRRVEDRSLS